MSSQNIVQEISPAIETLVLKIDFWLIIEILHSTKFCAPKSQCNSPWNVCKKINSLTFFPPVGWTSWSYWVGKLRIDRGEIVRISHILAITMYPNLFLFLAITISSLQISKASVKNWQSKLQTRYGWFKKENCKNIIFDVSISFCSYKATAPSYFMIKIKALLMWRSFSDLILHRALTW